MYGRHLVIDWAKEDDSLSDLREKTEKQFTANSRAADEATVALGTRTTVADDDEERGKLRDTPQLPRKKAKMSIASSASHRR